VAAEFRAAAGGSPLSPSTQALQQQLANAHDHIQTLEASNKRLAERIATLCAVIAELTHEAAASNVVALSRPNPQ
jgi:phage shock protein A